METEMLLLPENSLECVQTLRILGYNSDVVEFIAQMYKQKDEEGPSTFEEYYGGGLFSCLDWDIDSIPVSKLKEDGTHYMLSEMPAPFDAVTILSNAVIVANMTHNGGGETYIFKKPIPVNLAKSLRQS
jgi:hypothetical protein